MAAAMTPPSSQKKTLLQWGELLQTLGMEITRQIAAVPVRQRDNGLLGVLLATSRETVRWVIPKGWPWPDREERMGAAEGARAEAGVIGRISPTRIRTFTYHKRQWVAYKFRWRSIRSRSPKNLQLDPNAMNGRDAGLLYPRQQRQSPSRSCES